MLDFRPQVITIKRNHTVAIGQFAKKRVQDMRQLDCVTLILILIRVTISNQEFVRSIKWKITDRGTLLAQIYISKFFGD